MATTGELEKQADLWIRISDFFTPRLLELFKEAEIPVDVHSAGCDAPTLEYRGRFTQDGAIENLLRA